MSLALKEKELVAVGISVAAGCKPCTDYHIKAVRTCGATDDEIRQAIATAIKVRECALKIMKAHSLHHLDDASGEAVCGCAGTNRANELVAVGAAHAINCTTNLHRHLVAARNLGIADNELQEVVKLARFIKGKAATHVQKIVQTSDDNAETRERPKEAALADCGCN